MGRAQIFSEFEGKKLGENPTKIFLSELIANECKVEKKNRTNGRRLQSTWARARVRGLGSVTHHFGFFSVMPFELGHQEFGPPAVSRCFWGFAGERWRGGTVACLGFMCLVKFEFQTEGACSTV